MRQTSIKKISVPGGSAEKSTTTRKVSLDEEESQMVCVSKKNNGTVQQLKPVKPGSNFEVDCEAAGGLVFGPELGEEGYKDTVISHPPRHERITRIRELFCALTSGPERGVPECPSGWRLVSGGSPAARGCPNQGWLTIGSASVS
jgi:hypothetical protein